MPKHRFSRREVSKLKLFTINEFSKIYLYNNVGSGKVHGEKEKSGKISAFHFLVFLG